MNPKNVGEIKNADGVGVAGSLVCGDMMTLYIKVRNEEIIDIKFQTIGCAAAIATSSAVTEIAKNKTIKQALEITNKKIVNDLGGLPVPKIHCSLLAVDALKEAIYDYMEKNNIKIPEQLKKEHSRIKKERESVEENI